MSVFDRLLLDPSLAECVLLECPEDVLQEEAVHFHVWDRDLASSDDPLGDASLPALGSVFLFGSQKC